MPEKTSSRSETTTVVLLEITHPDEKPWWQALDIDDINADSILEPLIVVTPNGYVRVRYSQETAR